MAPCPFLQAWSTSEKWAWFRVRAWGGKAFEAFEAFEGRLVIQQGSWPCSSQWGLGSDPRSVLGQLFSCTSLGAATQEAESARPEPCALVGSFFSWACGQPGGKHNAAPALVEVCQRFLLNPETLGSLGRLYFGPEPFKLAVPSQRERNPHPCLPQGKLLREACLLCGFHNTMWRRLHLLVSY